jgi:16S rRNA (uracil1498-N3)-methyltransferase
VGKRTATLRCERKTADVQPPPDIDYLFAPLKHARLDYVIQKATELGAKRLRPVITERTISERTNLARMRANAIEAAEQCNLVFVPEICAPVPLSEILTIWPRERRLVYCDETAPLADPIAALKSVALPAALLVGPEGGFTDNERDLLRQVSDSVAISLGPRIVRADTAAVAGLALMQSTVGDWHQHR